MFSKNEFIKWTDTMINHTTVGRVIKDDGFRVEFETEFGTFNVQADDGLFERTSKPKNWTGSTVKATFTLPPPDSGEKPEQPKKAAPVKATGGKTKIDLIVDLLRANPDLNGNRKAAIAAIVDAGISTPAGASTFYNTAKGMV